MTRLFTRFAVVAVVVASVQVTAQAQRIYTQPHRSHGHLHDHDYWHHSSPTLNLRQLDTYSDQLAEVARHLHEDAHKLSQDYEHSASIERSVDSLDQLQQHMHQIIHRELESGFQSTSLATHVKSDVRKVRSLLSTVYRELEHQGFDGARTLDFQAIAHMRRIVVEQAMPLVRKMEIELYGYALDRPVHTHRQPTHSRDWGHYSSRYGHR